MRPGIIARLLVIAGSLVLLVLLMFANTTPPAKKPEALAAEVKPPDQLAAQIAAARSSIAPEQRSRIEVWEQESEKGVAGVPALDSLVKFWDASKRPDIAAFYTGKIAAIKNTKEAWDKAGKRFYFAVRFVKPEGHGELYSNAMECFSKALAFDPDDLEIKTSLAACYVEGSPDPMKGITMLREVVEADSVNVNALWQLGLFSMKSGQFDKAVARFEKIAEIDPRNLEVYLYIAEAYEKSGDKQNTIKSLEKYVSLTDDAVVKTEVQGYIDNLKKAKQ
jgi:tetratricopeptide (TPR) repeat protein